MIKFVYDIFGDCVFCLTSSVGKGKKVTEEDVNGLFFCEFFMLGEINVVFWDILMYLLIDVDVKKVLEKKSMILVVWINLNNSFEFSKL